MSLLTRAQPTLAAPPQLCACCANLRMRMCTHAHTYACVHVQARTRTKHTHAYVRTHICMHARSCMPMRTLPPRTSCAANNKIVPVDDATFRDLGTEDLAQRAKSFNMQVMRSPTGTCVILSCGAIAV